MQRKVLRFLAAAALALGAALPVLADAFDDGTAAYRREDYAGALRLWLPAAEAGDARAQYSLGALYSDGKGVAKDYVVAATWLRRAADRGHASAQSLLGLMYSEGVGVTRDPIAAHLWLSLALSARPPLSAFMRASVSTERAAVAQRLTPAELAEAEARARDWQPVK
jgi:uncharacterized protein